MNRLKVQEIPFTCKKISNQKINEITEYSFYIKIKIVIKAIFKN